MTPSVKTSLLAIVLGITTATVTVAVAESRVVRPVITIAGDRGECVAPPAEMRRNHMTMLRNQRNKTVREGVRGERINLNDCINCHASTQTGSVTGSAKDFCVSCHAYAAVTLDCFECHQPRASENVSRTESGVAP